ncbi:hypothetical protein [Flyfo microvirus Tbat2_110]|nr:hypothetical protein [Flyfo microvirus Tbat2_110]
MAIIGLASRSSYRDVPTSLKKQPAIAVAAKRQAPLRKPAMANAKITTTSNRQVSQLSLANTPEPDNRKSSHKAREWPHCKKRPDSKKAARSTGGGGAKKFIPWC